MARVLALPVLIALLGCHREPATYAYELYLANPRWLADFEPQLRLDGRDLGKLVQGRVRFQLPKELSLRGGTLTLTVASTCGDLQLQTKLAYPDDFERVDRALAARAAGTPLPLMHGIEVVEAPETAQVVLDARDADSSSVSLGTLEVKAKAGTVTRKTVVLGSCDKARKVRVGAAAVGSIRDAVTVVDVGGSACWELEQVSYVDTAAGVTPPLPVVTPLPAARVQGFASLEYAFEVPPLTMKLPRGVTHHVRWLRDCPKEKGHAKSASLEATKPTTAKPPSPKVAPPTGAPIPPPPPKAPKANGDGDY